MREKPLIKTNAYLKNSKLYEKLLFVNVSSSSAIELGTLSPTIISALKKKKHPKSSFALLTRKSNL